MHPPSISLLVRAFQQHNLNTLSTQSSRRAALVLVSAFHRRDRSYSVGTSIMRQSSAMVVLHTFMLTLLPSRSNGWIHQLRPSMICRDLSDNYRRSNTAGWKDSKSTLSTQQSRTLAIVDTSSLSSSSSIEMQDSTTPTSIDASSSSNVDTVTATTPVTIAEGTIVAQYPGGFTAIRINDANGFLEPANDPIVVGVEASSSTSSSSLPQNKQASTSSMNNISNGIKLTSVDYQGKMVMYPNGATGVVVAHRPPLVFCYSDNENISSDNKEDVVRVMDEMVKISFSPHHSHVDGFGKCIASTTNFVSPESDDHDKRKILDRVIFGPIPKVSEIALINHPMITGNTMIDTLAPIGRGQNMLLIGSQIDDMRSMARDFIKTQIITTKHQSQQSPTVCVYASTERDQTVAYQRMKDDGIADDIHYVGTKTTTGNLKDDDVSYAAEAVLVVNSAIAIAESYALKDHCHTIVVVDTIDLHKTLHDVTTRILVDTFGIQSVVQQDPNGGGTSSSEMRSFYSSFIQRAGQYNVKMGGGSVTLLLLTTIPPTANDADEENYLLFTSADFEQCSENIKSRIKIIESKGIALTASTLRKINIPLPTITEYDRRMQLQHIDELISMSDGQIWLDDTIPIMKPSIDPQKSITRIGVGADTPSRADAPAIRRIAEGIRLELVQSAMSSMTGTVVSSSATQNQIRRQKALLLAMYQPPGTPIRRLSDSCTLLLSARNGYFDASCIDQNIEAGSDEGIAVIVNLLQHVHNNIKDVMDEIDETLDITDSSKTILTESIAEYFATKMNSKSET